MEVASVKVASSGTGLSFAAAGGVDVAAGVVSLAGADTITVRVLVAVGGAAPPLPGLVAAMTTLPVIAVGARQADVTAAETLQGLLALPPGVPLRDRPPKRRQTPLYGPPQAGAPWKPAA